MESKKIQIKPYDGVCKELMDKCFAIFPERVEVGEDKIILCPNYLKWHEKYQNFEASQSDVWVVSYPKAGTTWTQEMVWCILYDCESDGANEYLTKRFPFFEWDSLLPEDLKVMDEIDSESVYQPGNTWKIVHTMNKPRTMKSHFHMSLLPPKIWSTKSKVVYVCRDPRDVLVSFYYHSVKLDGFTGTFDEFFEIFINDATYYSPFWKNVLDFYEKRNEENILFLRFEELKEDLPKIIKKVAKFLGKDLSEEYINKLTDHLSFSSMRNNKAVNNESIPSFKSDRADQIKFMRKGKVGDWKSHMSNEQISRMKKWTEYHLKDSNFPYYQD